MSSNKKVKKQSVFTKQLATSMRNQRDAKLTTEERKSLRYQKLDEYFEAIGNKQNRYLFYCPDIPFASTMVKTIYEIAYHLKQLHFSPVIIHEVAGYKPEWLKEPWVKELKVEFLQEKKKQGGFTTPVFNFKSTDTIIFPEGFWSAIQSLAEARTLQKVILCFGYGGFSVVEPGRDWSMLGFTDVICMSEKLKTDYESVWPFFNYHVLPYQLKEVTPLDPLEIGPNIGLAMRDRNDAQALINLFYNKYPYLNVFQFKVLRKLDTENYLDHLKHCALMVFTDRNAGHPAPPLEAIACNVPVITTSQRGMSHLETQEGIIYVEDDMFSLVEAIKSFCLQWLENATIQIKDKTILDNYKPEVIKEKISKLFDFFQEQRIKTFSAIKEAVDKGKLDDSAQLEQDENEEKQEEISEVTEQTEEEENNNV
jgi:hypothetical protein